MFCKEVNSKYSKFKAADLNLLEQGGLLYLAFPFIKGSLLYLASLAQQCKSNGVTIIIKQVASFKSSLLPKIDSQNTQTLQRNYIGNYLQK